MNLKITEDDLRMLMNVDGKRILFNKEVVLVDDVETERVVDIVGRRKRRRETIYLTSVKFRVWDCSGKYHGVIVDSQVALMIQYKDLQVLRADYINVVEQINKLDERSGNEKS